MLSLFTLAPRGCFNLENSGTLHAPLAYQNNQATGAVGHLRYNGGSSSALSDHQKLLKIALVRRVGTPALTGHHLVEMLPRIGASADTGHFVSAGKQLLPS